MARTEAVLLHVSGRVQGVGYRWFAEQEARAQGVRGYVRNLADGRVEAMAQAEPPTLEAFVARLREGPRAARVDDVVETPVPVDTELSSFEIRY